MKSVHRLALLFSLAALAATSATAHERRIRAGDLPTCSETAPDSVWLLDAASATTCDGTTGEFEAHCCCANGAWAACGGSGGGSGDVEAVWSCTSGDCSTLTGASGDSFDAGSADASSPATRSTSLPGTCSEGQFHQDTDSGGSETYVCTASNTWTKLSTTATVENDDVAPYGQYDPDNPPATCAICDEFTGGESLMWTWGNQDSATLTESLDGVLLDGVDTNEIHARWIGSAETNSDQTWCAAFTMDSSDVNIGGCGILTLESGTIGSPTQMVTVWAADATSDGFFFQEFDNYTTTGNTVISSGRTFDRTILDASRIYVKLSYVDATREICAYESIGGRLWSPFASCWTMSADPVDWGIFAREGARCFFDFARLLASADADCGE